jgi:two-component system sensor histidine kinase/response regulator
MLDFDSGADLMILNQRLALERVGGDEELLREVAQLFLEEYPRSLGEIRVAVEAGDAKLLEREAHSLKGAAANFGAEPVVSAALALEIMGRKAQIGEAPPGLAALEAALTQLHAELEALAAS